MGASWRSPLLIGHSQYGATWAAARPAPVLSGGAVHIWRISLDLPSSSILHLAGLLSGDETLRAGRFRLDRDRRRYVVSHGALRTILACYLGGDPSRIQFGCGPYGKPYLMGDVYGPSIEFSLAHAGEIALVAVARGRSVGVDLERIDPEVDFHALADVAFSLREKVELQTLPRTLQRTAFYACWTRKEAYLKARGDGLLFPPHKVDVSVHPDRPPVLLHVAGESREGYSCSLIDLHPASGHAGAVAVHGHASRCVLRNWLPTGHGLTSLRSSLATQVPAAQGRCPS